MATIRLGASYTWTMSKGRLEAFSDGVIAILITIMVLELKIPQGADLHALRPVIPVFLAYVLSFVILGIYWNNHHHMLHATDRINGKILWANLHLLFWLSLIPAATAWIGENRFGAGAHGRLRRRDADGRRRVLHSDAAIVSASVRIRRSPPPWGKT